MNWRQEWPSWGRENGKNSTGRPDLQVAIPGDSAHPHTSPGDCSPILGSIMQSSLMNPPTPHPTTCPKESPISLPQTWPLVSLSQSGARQLEVTLAYPSLLPALLTWPLKHGWKPFISHQLSASLLAQATIFLHLDFCSNLFLGLQSHSSY